MGDLGHTQCFWVASGMLGNCIVLVLKIKTPVFSGSFVFSLTLSSLSALPLSPFSLSPLSSHLSPAFTPKAVPGSTGPRCQHLP